MVKNLALGAREREAIGAHVRWYLSETGSYAGSDKGLGGATVLLYMRYSPELFEQWFSITFEIFPSSSVNMRSSWWAKSGSAAHPWSLIPNQRTA